MWLTEGDVAVTDVAGDADSHSERDQNRKNQILIIHYICQISFVNHVGHCYDALR